MFAHHVPLLLTNTTPTLPRPQPFCFNSRSHHFCVHNNYPFYAYYVQKSPPPVNITNYFPPIVQTFRDPNTTERFTQHLHHTANQPLHTQNHSTILRLTTHTRAHNACRSQRLLPCTALTDQIQPKRNAFTVRYEPNPTVGVLELSHPHKPFVLLFTKQKQARTTTIP